MNKEQIEEMARELFNIKTQVYSPFTNKYDGKDKFFAIAEELTKQGYHKTIWHKVSDGDLPKKYKEVLLLGKDYNYYIGSYAKDDESFHTDIGFDMDKNEVIAWTELSKYEE